MDCLQRCLYWGYNCLFPNNEGISEVAYRTSDEDDDVVVEFDDTSEFDENFLLPLSNVPGPWIARPVSVCGTTPSPHFRNKDLIVATMINVVSAGAIAGLGVVLAEESEREDFSVRSFSIPLILISVVVQSALELNAGFVKKLEARISAAKRPGQEWPPFEKVVQWLAKGADWQESVYNYLARFSTENFLYLWNAFLNVPEENKMASQGLYYSNVVLCTLLLTRNVFNLWKIRPGHYVDQLRSVEEGEPINRRLSPSSRNLVGKLVPYGLELGAGFMLWGLGGAYDQDLPGFGTLSYTLGTIAIFDAVGFFTAEATQHIWRRYEIQWLQTPDLDLSGSVNSSPQIPTRLFMFRRGTKVLRAFAVEFICISSGFIPLSAFSPLLGFFKGVMDNYQSRKFEVYTKEDQDHIRAESFNPGTETKKIAVRINQLSTAAFFTIFHGFFAYAFVESNEEGRIAIGALVAATDLSAIISRYLQYTFRPGQAGNHQHAIAQDTPIFGPNGRFSNQLTNDLLNNPYSLTVFYYAFTSIPANVGLTINPNSPFVYGSGIAAQIIFGLILGANQTQEYREVTFTPPIFDAQAMNLIAATLLTNSL